MVLDAGQCGVEGHGRLAGGVGESGDGPEVVDQTVHGVRAGHGRSRLGVGQGQEFGARLREAGQDLATVGLRAFAVAVCGDAAGRRVGGPGPGGEGLLRGPRAAARAGHSVRGEVVEGPDGPAEQRAGAQQEEVVGDVRQLVQPPFGAGAGGDDAEPVVGLEPPRYGGLRDHVDDVGPGRVLVQRAQRGAQEFLAPGCGVPVQQDRVDREGDFLQAGDVEVLQRDRRLHGAVDVEVAGEPVEADLDAEGVAGHGPLDPVGARTDDPLLGQIGVDRPELDLDALVLADPQVLGGVGAQPGEADHAGPAEVLPGLHMAARDVLGLVARGRDGHHVARVFLQQRAQRPAYGALVPLLHGQADPPVVEGGDREPRDVRRVEGVGDQVVVEAAGEVDCQPGVHMPDAAVVRGGPAFGVPELRLADAPQGAPVQAGLAAAEGSGERALDLAPHTSGDGGRGDGTDRLRDKTFVDMGRGAQRRRLGHVMNSVSSLAGAS